MKIGAISKQEIRRECFFIVNYRVINARKENSMIFHQGAKKYFLLIVAMTAAAGYGQNSVTFDVDGATAVVPQEIFGLLMERLGRMGIELNWVGMKRS